MALGTAGGLIAGAAVSGLASAGINALAGGGASGSRAGGSSAAIDALARGLPSSGFTPVGFRVGGSGDLAGRFSGGSFNISQSPERARSVRRLGREFRLEGAELGRLRERVRPGFGELSDARRSIFAEQRQRLENTRRRSVGDLRDNLARRRVSGSSFGSDAISRREAEFAQEERELSAQEAEAGAVSFLQELELTNNLITQEFEARRGEFQTALDDINLRSDIAVRLAGGASSQFATLAANAQSQLAANARLRAELAADAQTVNARLGAEEAAGRGEFFGQISEPFTSALGEGATGLFS